MLPVLSSSSHLALGQPGETGETNESEQVIDAVGPDGLRVSSGLRVPLSENGACPRGVDHMLTLSGMDLEERKGEITR